MIDAQLFKQKLLSDIRVELTEEFDRNFERKAFFTDKWKKRANPNARGTLLMVTGTLRRSIEAEVRGNGVRFTSAVPYASIHNEGGKITVTARMKRFFWYKYKQTKDEMWKRLALMKVGKTMTIPQRQFVGDGKRTQELIKGVIADNLKDFNVQLTKVVQANANKHT